MFNEIDPRLSPYYIGGFSLDILRKSKVITFDEWMSLVENKLGFKIGVDLFAQSITWLYIINQVESVEGRYHYVQD